MASRNKQLSRADQVRARRKIEPAHRIPIPQPSRSTTREAESASGNSRHTYPVWRGSRSKPSPNAVFTLPTDTRQ